MTSGNAFSSVASLLGGRERRVTNIRLSDWAGGSPSFEHITDLRGPDWILSRQDVVNDIRAGNRYYVDNGGGPRAYLEVMPSMTILGGPYVRTKPDCTPTNNLLRLERF